MAGTDKTIIDTGTKGPGVVPYLPLNELGKSPAAIARAPSGRQAMRWSLTGGAIAVILLIAIVIGYGTFFTV